MELGRNTPTRSVSEAAGEPRLRFGLVSYAFGSFILRFST